MRSLSKPTHGDVFAALLFLSDVEEIQGGIPDLERGIRAAHELSSLLRQHFMAGRVVRVLPFDVAVRRLLLGELLDYRKGTMITTQGGREYIERNVLPRFTDSEREELREAAMVFALAVA